ncbi:MAG: adenylate/guanylate cyclase domain-containing protein, partial [Pseudomonadota bacterium]
TAGVPLYRMFLLVPLLHPLYVGSGYIWRRSVEGIEQTYGEHGARERPEFKKNPIRLILDENYAAVRRRIPTDYVEGEFTLIDDLVKEGATDYVAMALEFTNGHRAAISFTSDQPSGFNGEQLAQLYSLLPLISRLVERTNLEQTAINILDAYVGHRAGQRILDGHITRGSRDSIYAGIWFCDLRSFTTLSDKTSRDQVISLLNSFFETMAEPVLSHGGEVMKFIGDAMLAVFPVEGPEQKRKICSEMLEAAKEAVAGMALLNEQRATFGEMPIDYGLALHIGEVDYGNIGAAGRLDFTVIGPAVNFAERIEQLCKRVPERPVLSEGFAGYCNLPVKPLGRFELAGLEGDHAIYSIADGDDMGDEDPVSAPDPRPAGNGRIQIAR